MTQLSRRPDIRALPGTPSPADGTALVFIDPDGEDSQAQLEFIARADPSTAARIRIVDVTQDAALARRYGVQRSPTIVFFDAADDVTHIAYGLIDASAIGKWLRSLRLPTKATRHRDDSASTDQQPILLPTRHNRGTTTPTDRGAQP